MCQSRKLYIHGLFPQALPKHVVVTAKCVKTTVEVKVCKLFLSNVVMSLYL